jgi:hypothetical protein
LAIVPAKNTLQLFVDSVDAIVEVIWLELVGFGRFGIEVVAYEQDRGLHPRLTATLLPLAEKYLRNLEMQLVAKAILDRSI